MATFSAKESRIANCAIWWQCRASSVQIQLIGYCLNQKKCLLGRSTSMDRTDYLSLQAFLFFGWIYWLCLLAIVGLYETQPEFFPPLNFALYHDTCWSWSCALLDDRTEAMQTPFVIGPHDGVQTLSLTFDAKMAPFIISFVLLNPASSSHQEESWIRCASFSESNFWDTRCWRLTV
jgi:hypothetical protein